MPAKHTPTGDDSFRASLLRNLGGGAALIVLVAAVFFGVGQFAGGDGAPEVAGSSGDADEEEPDGRAPEEEEPAPEPEEEPDDIEEPAEPEPEKEPTPEDDAEDPGDEAEEPDDADATEPEDDAGDDPEEPAGLEPGDISVQVLDGVGTDGGAASQRVATELDDLGYRIIARNPALAYEETTVMWTSGNEDRARKVAADLGVSAVRQQPGNLSEQVDVHVVVGADRA